MSSIFINLYEYGKSKLKRFLKDREITKLHKDTIKRIRNRLSANPDEKLNIVFLVEEDSKWNAQSLYDELKNEPRINVNIAVKKTQFSELLREKQLYYFKKNYDFFRKIDENTILLIGVPNEGSVFQQNSLNRSGAINTTDHVHFYTEKSLKKKLEQTGYKIQRVYRECFYIFNDKLFYKFTKNWIGFNFLSFLTLIFPQECSGLYFELTLRED